MTDKLMTVKEAGERLRVSPQTVRKWLKDGRLEGKKPGRAWLVTEESVERLLSQVVV